MKPFFFFLLFIFSIWLDAIEGKIILSDGTSMQGKITLHRKIYFRDLFLEKAVSIPLEEIYCIEPLLEGLAPHQTWDKDYPQSLERRFIMGIHTWKGKSYWGRQNLSFSIVYANQKNKTFLIPKVQVIWNYETATQTEYIKQILFQPNIPYSNRPKPLGTYPIPNLISISGQIKPQGIFHTVLAFHSTYSIVWEGRIGQDGISYCIPRIMPGKYHIFLIGQKHILFGISMPDRKDLLDKVTEIVQDQFASWIQKKSSETIHYEVLHAVGRYSKTYSLVLEETKTMRKTFLWNCYRLRNSWQLRHQHLIHTQNIQNHLNQERVIVLYDPALESIPILKNRHSNLWNYTVY